MILGEAYACRALVHFDLLRLFAPALIHDDGENGCLMWKTTLISSQTG